MAVANSGSARRPLVSSKTGGGIHRAYTAQLTAKLGGANIIDITAPLPVNYQLQLSTNFDNPFNEPLANLAGPAGSAAGNIVTATTGVSTRAKWLSNSVWQGGNLMKITVPFTIVAQYDPQAEIVAVMRNLLKLVAPLEENGMLRAPGPNFGTVNGGGDSTATGELISIRLGNFFEMSPCVIDDVMCDFDTQMEAGSQCPMSATITVSASSYQTTTRQDLDKYFKSKVAGT